MDNKIQHCKSDEIENLKIAKQQADIKLQLLKKQYKEDVSQFNESRVEQIFKNSGAREYLERLKDRTKIKDDIINNLREDLEFKNKEIAELEDRCRRIELAKEEYLRHWKDAQSAKERLEAEVKSGHSVREHRHISKRQINMSTTSSLIDKEVPPPPPIDVPSLDEILGSALFPQDNTNPYTSLDSSIPPPPPMDVPIDELLFEDKQKAFQQEQGQFLCHIYVAISSDSTKEVLDDVVELVESEQIRSPEKALQGWKTVSNKTQVEILDASENFHVTLIRGHRIIYHHQIDALLSCLETEINNHSPIRLCLDTLKLFYNHEGTKQFLCLATRESTQAREVADLVALKNRLRIAMDQFATRMTDEDESLDTLAHCSLMCRDVQQVEEPAIIDKDLKLLERLCADNLTEVPICFVPIDTIHIKIGNRIYNFSLSRISN